MWKISRLVGYGLVKYNKIWWVLKQYCGRVIILKKEKNMLVKIKMLTLIWRSSSMPRACCWCTDRDLDSRSEAILEATRCPSSPCRDQSCFLNIIKRLPLELDEFTNQIHVKWWTDSWIDPVVTIVSNFKSNFLRNWRKLQLRLTNDIEDNDVMCDRQI